MGNQGTTNWKFSLFLVIALTLVAGLFADTALAGRGDGEMTYTLGTTPTLVEAVADPQVLAAGSSVGGITFTYTADDSANIPIDMNGGRVRLDIDAAWKVKDEQITVTDGADSLFLTSARLTSGTAGTTIRGPAVKDDRDLRRITLTINGDGFVTRVEVELDSAAWGIDRAVGRTLTIVVGSADSALTVPIPTRLNVVDGIPFASYRFTAWSSAAIGGYARLTDNDNDVNTTAHPEIKVGNIPSTAAGTATVTPKIYVGDEGDIKITFKAAGPIYDINATVGDPTDDLTQTGDVDAQIAVNFADAIGSGNSLKQLPSPLPRKIWVDPAALGTPIAQPATVTDELNVNLDPPPAVTSVQVSRLLNLVPAGTTADGTIQTTNRRNSGFVSITKRSGVVLGNPALTIDGTTVTINIVKMDKDGIVELTHKKMWASAAATALVDVTVTSDGTADTTADLGEILARPGTGTMKITDMAVQVDTPRDFLIEYKADTRIENAYLAVEIPANAFMMPDVNDDTQLTALRLTDANHPDPSTINADNPHPNGDRAGARYGRVEIVTRQTHTTQTLHLAGDATAANTTATAFNVVVWGPIALNAGSTFQGRIRNVRITGTTGVYDWSASLNIAPATRPSDIDDASRLHFDGTDTAAPLQLYVLKADANPLDPDVTFEISEAVRLPLSTLGSAPEATAGQGGFGFYDAAGRYRITFKFTAVRTPLKQGKVTVTLPPGWSEPKKDKNMLGYTTVSAGTLAVGGQTITLTKLDMAAGDEVTIVYGAASDPPDAVTDDMLGALVQPDAGDEVIKSTFDVDDGGSIRQRASNEVNLTVGNVAAGSGKATIRPSSVEAGSLVSLTAVYTASGTMNGGQVSLQMPEDWGDLQQHDDEADNYVQVTSSGGTLGDWDTSDDIVQVNLATFDEDDTINFALKNVVAQPSNLGVVNFKIYSAGKPGETAELLVGEEPPPNAYTNEGANLALLLGRVYTTDCIDDSTTTAREDFDGFLRVAVTGGGDGGGEVAVEIVASENSGDYDYVDDTATLTGANQLHAGDPEGSANLLFTYTPIETIIDGELKFTVPSGWDDPQTDSPSTAGFTVINSGGRIGAPDASGDSVTVPIYLINRDDTITIDYGSAGGGVTPPTSMGPETFTISVKGSATGRLKPVLRGERSVDIRPQATGKGVAAVAADGMVYAGSTENSFTITYTSVGQVVNGDLKITVPDGWSATSANTIGISGGSVAYGDPSVSDDEDDFTDGAGAAREVIISGINLSAGGSYSVTYENVTVQSTAAEGVAFKIEFRGAGPGTGFGAVGVPVDETGAAIDADAQKVDVLDVEPGSGMVSVKGPAVVTVGLTAYDISIIYTAEAQISSGKVIAVQIPEGWSDPIDADQAMDDDGNYNVGTYTVMHKKADGTYFTDRYGDNTNGMVEKGTVANRMLMATVTGDGVKADETVTFTYQNATAPADAGPSEFQVYYDDAMVESDDDTVIVQSAEGVTMLALSSEADTFFIDNNGTLTVTVTLQAADGSAATRAVNTMVTLGSDSATGSFNPAKVTIPAGETMGMSDYSDGSVGSVEITASVDGVPTIAAADGDKALMIIANTQSPTLQSVSFSVNGDLESKVAKDLDTITVMATGTLFQTVTFMIENVNFSGISMTDPDNDGTYTGDHRLARGSAEGMHSVTVTMSGVSAGVAADDKLTIDNALPDVEAAASSEADMITITATVTDATDVTVAAAVSMQGSEAAADSVALSDDDSDGTYEGMHTVSDGVYDITVTATDAAGNEGMGTATVTVDNTAPVITGQEIDMKQVMVGGMATISATLSEAATVSADVSMLNADAPTLSLMDADGDGEGMVYEGTVEVTEEGDAADIAIEITATDAAGNTGTASVTMVTLDNTDPVITGESIDMSHVMAGSEATISAMVSEAATVSADVSMLNADAPTLSLMDADGSGMYSGKVMVTADGDAADIAIAITATDAAGNMGTASVMVTLDNTAPMITDEAIDMSHVMAGSEVTISAMVSEAATVSADVSMLNADAPTLSLMDADGSGMYSGKVMVTADGDAADIAIAITATDAAGNMAEAVSVMVTLDNTAPEITGESIDMSHVMAGDEATISAMVSEAATVSADVSMLNADAPTLSLMDADGSGMYSGTVMVTADGDVADIAIGITATDAAGNMGTASVMVTLDNTVPTVEASADKMYAKNGDTVMLTAMVSEAANVSAVVSQLDNTQLAVALTDDDGDLTYTGPVMISMSNTAADGAKEITVTATDAAGNSSEPESVSVMLDNTVPEVTDVSGSPSPARNGHEVTISATVSEASTVSADVSDLDTMQTEMVMLTDDDGDGTYTGTFTISDDNEAENGSRQVTVTATDAAGNSGSDTGTVDLINTLDYTSILPAGISLFHVPLDVTAIDGSEASLSMVSDLYNALGDAVNYLITYDGTTWNSYLGGDSGDAPITADTGIVAVMRTGKTIKFTGNAWGEDAGPGAGEGASMITLRAGLNLVGVPVNDASISTVSSIMNLSEFAGKVTSIIASTDDGKFVQVAAGGTGDGAVRGDAAYLVSASAAASQPVTGEGWSNGEAVGAAPIALFGHTVDNQTPALFVEGSIVDELTGLAKAGFRIKVKNLSTKAALNTVSQSDVSQGYSMTFVDTNAGNAARIGDVLEISADSPDPLIGVKPVRHVVTVDDVKNSRIQLEDLVTYEIPAETALLNNYPNPFNPETWIPYHLSEDADVKLTIYDISGEVVRDIDVGHQIAAKYDTRSKAIYWDGRNRFGEQVASGIYFYHLQAGDFSGTRKMVILK